MVNLSNMLLIAVSAILAFTRQLHCAHDKFTSPRIAIVGGGIGGASAAHYLSELYENKGAKINVYEANRVGGRLATTFVNNHEYEVGGSVIHPRNKYMSEFTKLTGLEKLRKVNDGRFGLYNGNDYLFTESNWQFISLLKMLWRYGFSVFKWQKLIDDTLNSFSKIYDQQDEMLSFTSVEKLLASMSPNFVNLTQTTIQKHLSKLHFSEPFIDEFGMAIARVNYGQTNSINGFVGEVALAGATPGLWSVAGGNYLVVERLLQNANLNVIFEKVVEVSYSKEGNTFKVHSLAPEFYKNNNVHLKQEEYDIVIITVPLIDQVSNITFTGFPQPIKNLKGVYHRTIATIVEGEINKSFLKLNDDGVDSILTTTTQLEFNSLSRIYPLNNNADANNQIPKVWKVFSQQPLTERQLDNLFIIRSETQTFDWLAYPHYSPPEELTSFLLHPNLPIFYTSAIEWAASAMEMSCIAGRNAAILAYKWFNEFAIVEKIKLIKSHSEL